jgi:hypothetical protein
MSYFVHSVPCVSPSRPCLMRSKERSSQVLDIRIVTIVIDYNRALLRIFRMCDKDKDGLLDDYELQEFQSFVFKAELKK